MDREDRKTNGNNKGAVRTNALTGQEGCLRGRHS